MTEPFSRWHGLAPGTARAALRASGAQPVVTGNWGNDLTLLVKATRDQGLPLKYCSFHGKALGVADVGAVHSVAEWHPNVGPAASDAFALTLRRRFPEPRDDCRHLRMQALVQMLAVGIERAGRSDAPPVARALEGARCDARDLGGIHAGTMRAEDHQFQQPLYVSRMERAGMAGVRFDVEGSGYGFRTVRRFDAAQMAQPCTCRMQRPEH